MKLTLNRKPIAKIRFRKPLRPATTAKIVLRRRIPVLTEYRSLMVHQEDAIEYADKMNHPAFFMHMRLGKTLTVIRWIAKKKYVRHAVVVAPLTVLEAWENELTEEGEEFISCYGLTREKRIQQVTEALFRESGRVWILINYESLRTIPMLAQAPLDCVILDESTRIKNPKAQITKLCTEGFRDVLHRVILTGLPKPESELEIFCQFKFLHGYFAGTSNYWYYRKKYFSLNWEGKWEIKSEYKDYIKKLVHGKAFVLTRFDAGMGEKKVYETRKIELTAKQKKLYTEAVKEFSVTLDNGEKLETQWVLTAQVWASQIAGGFEPDKYEVDEVTGKKTLVYRGKLISSEKTKEIIELLNGELHGQKVIIWYRFLKELEHDAKELAKAGFSLVTIHGDVPQFKRKQRLEQFRGNTQLMLASETVARYGLDCSVADTAIYRGNEWSCESRVQSEDRIVHPKKKRPLLIIDLVTKGTIDEEVAQAVRGKAVNAQMFMRNMSKLFNARRAELLATRRKAA